MVVAGLVAKLVSGSCDPMDCSLPGSSVHGIFQARILEWAAIAFSRSKGAIIKTRDSSGKWKKHEI